MTLRAKHGFSFAATCANDPVVQAFLKAHIVEHGYPADTEPTSHYWVRIVKGDHAYGVFGWKRIPIGVEIPDFYLENSRFGVLAGYAALEKIKDEADARGYAVVTATPYKNERMMSAYQRVFAVNEPRLLVWIYDPKGAI